MSIPKENREMFLAYGVTEEEIAQCEAIVEMSTKLGRSSAVNELWLAKFSARCIDIMEQDFQAEFEAMKYTMALAEARTGWRPSFIRSMLP